MYIYIRLWLIHFDVGQKPTQYCKAIIPQFKKKRCQPGLQSPEGLIEAGGSTSLVTHAQAGAAGQRLSVRASLCGCLTVFSVVTGFCQRN